MPRRRTRQVFVGVLLFVLFAGEAIRNTVSWWGFIAIALVLAIASAVVVVRRRSALLSLVHARSSRVAAVIVGAYVLWATLSLIWSFYAGGTAIGIVILVSTTVGAAAIAVLTTWAELLRVLAVTLSVILAGSLVFELAVSVFVRQPILPVFPIIPDEVPANGPYPDSFYWSRDLLFEGGRIQGILGNANLLGFVALLALICSVALLGERRARRLAAVGLLLSLACLALTRSTTVLVALGCVMLVALIVLLVRTPRTGPPRRLLRGALGAGLAAAVVGLAVVVSRSSDSILAAVGKSSDLTGRLDIWEAVLGLIAQRPVVGWGWISYWNPWVAPFEGLAVRRGVTYLQAHNAYLDVLLQLGAIGLVIFVVLLIAVLVRTVRAAGRGGWVALAPVLLLSALLAQSLAESRLLVEGNWALLVLLALTPLTVAPIAATVAPDERRPQKSPS